MGSCAAIHPEVSQAFRPKLSVLSVFTPQFTPYLFMDVRYVCDATCVFTSNPSNQSSGSSFQASLYVVFVTDDVMSRKYPPPKLPACSTSAGDRFGLKSGASLKMNSPVFERVGGSSTKPSPNGSFPTNHFGACFGARARDAMALATISVAARVLPCAARRLAWCEVVESERLFESVTCCFSPQKSLHTEDVCMREPRTSPEAATVTNAATRSVQSQ